MRGLKRKPLKEIFYTLLIAFAIISFWRGVWGMMDHYLFPSDKMISLLLSIIIGILILYFTENKIRRLIS